MIDIRRIAFCRLSMVAAALLLSAAGAPGQGPTLTPPQPLPGRAQPLSSPAPVLERPPDTPMPPEEEMVAEVRIRGNRSIPVEKILPHVQTRKGRPFSAEKLEGDVRRLNNTHWFVTIKTSSRRVPAGRVIIFEVLERPTLQYVKFIGNQKIKRKVLEREAGIKQGDAMDPAAIEESRRIIEEFYKTRGFTDIRITIAEGTKPDDRGAVFVINEGHKRKIQWTSFIGNTIASDARLRTQIESKPGILWVFEGDVNKRELEEDVDRLTAYYRGLGFFRARIGHPLVEYSKNGEWAHVTFIIDEGPRYVIRNVSVIGNEKLSASKLTEELKLTAGQYFNQDSLSGDIAALREEYGAVGYIFADVKADPRFLEEPGKLDLVYNISEGDRYRVGRINVDIDGENPHTKIATVLNRISLQPGDIVDIRELRDSERRLKSSRLFEVNPAGGAGPKIVFTRPGLDDMTPEEEPEERPVERVAGRPQRSGGMPDQDPGGLTGSPQVRFQSPSGSRWANPLPYSGPSRRTTYRPPAEAPAKSDRFIDLTLFGRLLESTDGGTQ